MKCRISFYWIWEERHTHSVKEKKQKAGKTTYKIWRRFRTFQHEGLYALFKFIIQQIRPTTKNGHEYTHLWSKHANPFRWPRNNDTLYTSMKRLVSAHSFSPILCFTERGTRPNLSESEEFFDMHRASFAVTSPQLEPGKVLFFRLYLASKWLTIKSAPKAIYPRTRCFRNRCQKKWQLSRPP